MRGCAKGASALLFALASAAVAGCGDDGDGALDPTHEHVAAIVARSCAASSSCHGGSGTGQARLNFAAGGGDLTAALLRPDGSPRPSCEYDLMPVVDPGNPENSWIMVKLAGPVAPDGTLDFQPDADWIPDTSDPECPRTDGAEVHFGRPMPLSLTRPTPLAPAELEAFRGWIAMGAQGPP